MKLSDLVKFTKNNYANGFTLIELVIVIVLLGIAGSMGADFISQTFLGFSAVNSRMEVFEEGKLAMMRMEYEIRNSIPNAVNLVGSDDLRIGLIHEGRMKDNNLMGTYKETAGDLLAVPNVLTDEDSSAIIPLGWILSVYNQNWSQFDTGTRLFKVINAGNSFTVDANINEPSPRSRYYVADKAIRFYLASGNLYREAMSVDENGLTGVFNGSSGYLLAKDVSSLNFKYLANPVVSKSSLVVIDFSITKNGETLDFHKEVHIRNVP